MRKSTLLWFFFFCQNLWRSGRFTYIVGPWSKSQFSFVHFWLYFEKIWKTKAHQTFIMWGKSNIWNPKINCLLANIPWKHRIYIKWYFKYSLISRNIFILAYEIKFLNFLSSQWILPNVKVRAKIFREINFQNFKCMYQWKSWIHTLQ